MPLVEVACPGCQAVLKAPDTMAGKKARCKRCNTPFRIPGGAPTPDSVGESQKPSAAVPAPAARKPAEPPPAEDDIPSAMPVDDDEPLSAPVAPEQPPADPFAFTAAPEPKKVRKPRDEAAESDHPAPRKKPAASTAGAVEDAPPPAAEEPSADPFAFAAAPAAKGDPAGDEDPAAEADAGDPFGFSPSAAPKSKTKLNRKPREEPADDDRPAAKTKKPAGGGGGLVKIAVAAAVFAVVAGGVVAGVLIYLNNKPGEQAKNDKKDEKKLDPPPGEPPPPEKSEPTTKAKEAGKGPKGTPIVGGNKATKGTKTSGGMLVLGPAKELAFPPKPADPKMRIGPASEAVSVTVAFAEVRRFFPPGKSGSDVGVAWRSATGFQGAGEKITISLFSPTSGTETGKVEVDSDGQPDPACDLSADAGTFVLGNRTTGKVTIWDVRKKAKKLDAFDPYKEKPEHKAAKLAAVYLTEPPDRVVTVTTAGAVHVWDVATKAEAGEFVPPRGAPGKVVAGRSAVALANRQGVAVAVGGAVYSVTAAGAVGGTAIADLGGDVGKSLALAVSPGGRVVYAFETDADGKKERAVAHLAEGKSGPVFRWPADAGEPTGASWSGDAVAAVTAGPGSGLLFDGEEGAFRAQAVLRAADDKAAAGATDGGLWALLPVAADPKRCVALEIALPLPPIGDPTLPPNSRPVGSMVLDLRGLAH